MISTHSCALIDMTDTTHSSTVTHKPRPFVDLLVSILIPSLILMKLSGDSRLGADGALILALAFPVTIDGGEWLQGAGQFNFLRAMTDEDWAAMKPKKS
jgi:hypothetical protein